MFDIENYFEKIEEEEIFSKCKDKNVLNIFKNAKENILNNIKEKEIKTENIESDVLITGNVYIDSGTIVKKGAIIEGPVYIGKNCEISYRAYVRPGTVMGDNCVIGYNSEVKNTIMRNGSKISSLSFVGDSILGKNSRVGSGVIAANRAFSQSNIIVKDEDKNKIELDREFLGVIEGDNCRIGSNATTQPGTFIGKYSWIYPHTCIRGFIPPQKKVYNKDNIVMLDKEKKELYKATDYHKDKEEK